LGRWRNNYFAAVGNAPIGILLPVRLPGELKSSAALSYFKAVPNAENDLYLKREVLTALTKARVTEDRAILCEATTTSPGWCGTLQKP
jgi:hypothetical protein